MGTLNKSRDTAGSYYCLFVHQFNYKHYKMSPPARTRNPPTLHHTILSRMEKTLKHFVSKN